MVAKTMTIANIMTKSVISVDATITVNEAAKIDGRHKSGSSYRNGG